MQRSRGVRDLKFVLHGFIMINEACCHQGIGMIQTPPLLGYWQRKSLSRTSEKDCCWGTATEAANWTCSQGKMGHNRFWMEQEPCWQGDRGEMPAGSHPVKWQAATKNVLRFLSCLDWQCWTQGMGLFCTSIHRVLQLCWLENRQLKHNLLLSKASFGVWVACCRMFAEPVSFPALFLRIQAVCCHHDFRVKTSSFLGI